MSGGTHQPLVGAGTLQTRAIPCAGGEPKHCFLGGSGPTAAPQCVPQSTGLSCKMTQGGQALCTATSRGLQQVLGQPPGRGRAANGQLRFAPAKGRTCNGIIPTPELSPPSAVPQAAVTAGARCRGHPAGTPTPWLFPGLEMGPRGKAELKLKGTGVAACFTPESTGRDAGQWWAWAGSEQPGEAAGRLRGSSHSSSG